MTLIQQIYASSRIEDLDDAVRPIQELIGVTDGGHADSFFGGIYEAEWPNATGERRRRILIEYIEEELAWEF